MLRIAQAIQFRKPRPTDTHSQMTIIEFLSTRIGRNQCINVIRVGFEEVGYAYFQIEASNWLT